MNANSSLYTGEIADHILRELRSGRPLSEVCRDDGMPHHHTVTSWVKQDH
jgi:terminase small subunit-like protein